MLNSESLLATDPPLDFHWITSRLALGGGIWTAANMRLLAAQGITHVLGMQAEFDDNTICGDTGVRVLWNPCDDDFEIKPPELFRRAVDFAVDAYQDPRSRLYFHCAAGVHRGPMMLAAFLCVTGMELDEAIMLIRSHRPDADFPPIYRESIVQFLHSRLPEDSRQ